VSLIVQKYGGTSVGSTERIRNVAKRVARFHAQGHQIVVVVSAMSGETNRLLALTQELSQNPDPREVDVVAATGEQVTIGLLAIALREMGLKARSYTGGQVRILTDNAHTKARILEIDERPIRQDLAEGTIVVVAGFQGVDRHGNVTTLGRGGSDTSGVALAAALKADPKRAGSTGSRSRKCSSSRARARRCCRSAPSNSPASTWCGCACCRRSRMPTRRRPER
jgi:aspartate kinase